MEALFCGIEVVATRCPGAVAILKNGDLGTIVENDNVDSLIQGLQFILNDKVDRREDILRERAMNYNVTSVANKYLDFITN